MPDQVVRAHTQRLDQPEQRHLDREQRRPACRRSGPAALGVRSANTSPQRPVKVDVQLGAQPRRTPPRTPGTRRTTPAHPGPLRTLTGEHERQPSRAPPTPDHARPAVTRPAPQRADQLRPVAEHDRPVLERRPRRRPARTRHPPDATPRHRQPTRAAGPPDPRSAAGDRADSSHGTSSGRVPAPAAGGHCPRRRLLEDDVGVGAADPERRHPRPTRPIRQPATAAPRSTARTAPADQSTCDDGSSTCNVARQHPMPHRHHHLDHPRHTRRGLRMTDIRLHRPQPQRPSRADPAHRSPTTPAPRSDHPTSSPSHAPPPHPHQPPTTPQFANAAGSPAAATDHSAPSNHSTHHPDSPHYPAPPPTPDAHPAAHPTTAPPTTPHTLRPTRPVRRRRKRLDTAIHRQPTLPRKLHERAGVAITVTPPANANEHSPRPQRLHRQMQRHQRRRTRRIHRHRRTLKPERVRHPTRHHTARVTRRRRSPRAVRGVSRAQARSRGTSRRRTRRCRMPRNDAGSIPARSNASQAPPATTAAADPSPTPHAARSRRTPHRTRRVGRKPPWRAYDVPPARVRVEQSLQVPTPIRRESPDPVTADATSCHRCSGDVTPPGNRQAIPTIAIGSSTATAATADHRTGRQPPQPTHQADDPPSTAGVG